MNKTRRAWRVAIFLLLGLSLFSHSLAAYDGLETVGFFALTAIQFVLCLLTACQILGWRGGFSFLVPALAFGWIFERLSMVTGFPFGYYEYTDVLGPTIGSVPVVIPPAWFVVTYMGYSLAALIVDRAPGMGGSPGRILWRSLIAGFLVGIFDLCLDPFMVEKIKAWIMLQTGPYFGETWQGYLGWVFVGFVVPVVFEFVRHILGGVRPVPVTEPRWAVAVPLILYAAWSLFLTFAGPADTRLVALLSMGLGALAAASGLSVWQPLAAGVASGADETG